MPPARRPAAKASSTAPASASPGASAPGTIAPPPFTPPTHRLVVDPASRQRLLETEYLLTDGLGGLSMGTASGVPSRRYHALLIAALSPPVGRVALLNATADALTIVDAKGQATTAELSTFRFSHDGSVLHPGGLSRLESFELSPDGPRWTFRVPVPGPNPGPNPGADLTITRTLHLFRAESAAALTYTISRPKPAKAAPAVRLSVRPLLSLRDMHALIRRPWADAFASVHGPRECRVSRGQLACHLRSDAMAFTPDAQWWYDFHYALDAQRGQDCLEDLYSPGVFELALGVADTSASATLQASLAPLAMLDTRADIARTLDRKRAMFAAALASRPDPIAPIPEPDARVLSALVSAADDFVVARRPVGQAAGAPDQSSVIAGYPWFADWGRDTSIALPGLMLATGRFDDARRCLLAFASHRRNGIVPNVFDDRTGVPEFNTVDASLWFVLACCRYARRTGDRPTFDGLLAPACLDVVSAYRRGTDFNIAMDPMDKLITAGSEATQLTWMDARRDGVAFTPRHGKAVEINALWHAALRELAAALAPAHATTAANLTDLASAVARSFRSAFWDAQRSCLFDRLAPSGLSEQPGWTPISEMRPNQIFAVSLPHSPLDPDQQLGVLAAVRHHLLTPMGLRTLGPDEPGFRPRYQGDLFERDRAYHNGTVWPWLLGPYAQALLNAGAGSPKARADARAALEPAVHELFAPRASLPTPPGPIYGNCLGQLAEVYDATDPQRPQGCTAQAWSVAQLLEAWLML